MKTQYDTSHRVVAVSNLKAMCERVSGVCHNYTVTKVTRSRVHVTYSNPDEYGTPYPMTAVFPCYPNSFDGPDNPLVVLDITNILHDNWGGEGYQCFLCLTDCPTLWLNNGKWQTREEIEANRH